MEESNHFINHPYPIRMLMKLFTPLALALSIFLLPSAAAFAQQPETLGAPIATVNIRDAKITSQEKNVIRIHFTLTNESGVQSGVRYGVSLISDANKKQVVVDEKAYDESFTLGANGSVTKDIEYVAPLQLEGAYTVALTSSNDSGFPFAFVPVGKVTLTSLFKGVSLVPDSCVIGSSYVSTTPIAVPSTLPAEVLVVKCMAVNASASAVVATPTVETYYRNIYGDMVAPAVSLAPISFAAKEKKTVSFSVTAPTKAQAYQSIFSFRVADQKSNTASVRYVVRGVSATIQNASLDKESYVRGDAATISVVWSGSADAGTDAAATSFVVSTSIKNSYGMSCGTTPDQNISNNMFSGVTAVPVEIQVDCAHPTVSVSLKDAKGDVLDQQTYAFGESGAQEAQKPMAHATTFMVGFLLLLVIALVSFIRMIRGKKTPPTVIPPSLALFIALGIGALIPFHSAEASTFPMGVYGNAYATVDLNQATYLPGAVIRVNGAVTSTSSAYSNPVTLTVTTTGLSSPISLINQNLLQGTTASNQIFMTAPSTPGSYSANFVATIDETAPYNPHHVFFVGAFRWGKIIYTGPANHTDLITVRVQLHGTNGGNPGNGTSTGIHVPDTVFYIPPGTTNSYRDAAYNIPCTTSSGCEIEGTGGFMYGVVTSITSSQGAQLDSQIQLPYHVCRYNEDPAPDGNYFAIPLEKTCSDYPGSTQYQ